MFRLKKSTEYNLSGFFKEKLKKVQQIIEIADIALKFF